MSDIKISQKQAYLATYSFLEKYGKLTKSEDIACLLSSMSLLNDGTSADPAMLNDWNEAIKKAVNGEVDALLRFVNT